MKKRDAVMAVLFVLLGLTITLWSATFPFGNWEDPGPGFVPFALGLVVILLGGILFFQAITRKERGSQSPSQPLIPKRAAFIRVASTLGGMLLSAAVFLHLGFILTTFFLILFMMRSIQPLKWRVTLFYGLISAFGSFVLFQLLLKTPLPRGPFGF